MDIYLTASQFGKYPGLPTSTSVNNCYLIPLVCLSGLVKRNSRDPAGDIYSARFWGPSFRRREKCPQDQTPRLTPQLSTPQVVERSATLTRTIILNLLMHES